MITLPEWAIPQTVEPRYVDYGFNSQPILGGAITRTNRLGNRFALSVTMPPFPNEREGRILISRLIRAKSQGLQLRWPQSGFKSKAFGSPVIDGAGQLGTTLNLTGFTEGAVIREGQFFSFTQNGRSYLHQSAAESVADALGDVALTIEPELRVATVDGAVCDFNSPVVDGVVQGEEWAWNISLAHDTNISFDLVERY